MNRDHPFQIHYAEKSDLSIHRVINFISSFDQENQILELYAPSDCHSKLPLVLAPHPITWKAEEEYYKGPEYLYKPFHDGYFGLAEKYHVLIALPHGHHRNIENCSLGYPAQIQDLADLSTILIDKGFPVDLNRVYIIGNSMGAQEALLTAGKFPDRIAACVASNPVVDLAAWYYDLKDGNDLEIMKFKTWDLISNEVGGTPELLPDAYAERSAFSFVDKIKDVPTLILWSEYDRIVPHQEDHQAYKFYQTVKGKYPLAPMSEFNHSRAHGLPSEINDSLGYEIHEWSDYELYLQWCLRWTK